MFKLLLSLTEHSNYLSPIGLLQIGIIEDKLAWIGLPFNQGSVQENRRISDSPLMKQIKHALSCYFTDPRYHFEIPLLLHGTPFQKTVWEALQQLPVNTTLTYGELATRLNTHPRAIGSACRTNNIPIIIPCHRILAKAGLGGYAGGVTGKWSEMKTWLINHEQLSDRTTLGHHTNLSEGRMD
jgi:methylated-DNA-[protein]-cysteine S-methyltransferase